MSQVRFQLFNLRGGKPLICFQWEPEFIQRDIKSVIAKGCSLLSLSCFMCPFLQQLLKESSNLSCFFVIIYHGQKSIFFQAEAIKAIAVFIIYCSCDAAEPTGNKSTTFIIDLSYCYWGTPETLRQPQLALNWMLKQLHLRGKSWQDIFQTHFICLSHDLTRSFFQYKFCLVFHAISYFQYFVITVQPVARC